MAFRRMQAPAIYRREPLERLIATLVGDLTFENLVHPLVINTVEINSGMQVIWGRPGLRDVRVGDCVFASCALPGMLPPQEIRGAFYVDGALVENLPVRIAALEGNSPVIALDVGSSTVLRAEVEKSGFAATYLRGLEIVMDRMMETDLQQWEGPPLLLVHPRVEHVGMFSFNHSRELIEEGYRATRAALAAPEGFPERGPGIYPRRTVQVRVDRERCIGCGSCVMHAPAVFRLDAGGKAEILEPIQEWSPIDGGYVRNCPTYAISARLA
jgi:NTE family protein